MNKSDKPVKMTILKGRVGDPAGQMFWDPKAMILPLDQCPMCDAGVPIKQQEQTMTSADLPDIVFDKAGNSFKVVKPTVPDADNWVRLIPVKPAKSPGEQKAEAE